MSTINNNLYIKINNKLKNQLNKGISAQKKRVKFATSKRAHPDGPKRSGKFTEFTMRRASRPSNKLSATVGFPSRLGIPTNSRSVPRKSFISAAIEDIREELKNKPEKKKEQVVTPR